MQIAILYDPADNTEPAVPHKRRKRRPKLDREEVQEALQKLGHDARLHEIQGPSSLEALRKSSPELVFNLAESFDGDDSKDFNVAAMLELLDLPFTGAGSRGLLLAQDKTLTKKLLAFHGILTPTFAATQHGRLDHAGELAFPLIVKPASEDGSVGIDASSVVSSIKELMERSAMIEEKFGCAALIEQYVEGRELYCAVLGDERLEALPIVELDLSKLPEGMPKIAGREVKWEEGTPAYDLTKSAIAEDLDADVIRRLQETAVASCEALRLRDYVRIDVRLAKDGKIYVIEANPNPWLSSKAEVAIAARAAGLDYAALIGRIVELATARIRH